MLMVALMVGGAALLIISCLILFCACANSCLCTPSRVRRLSRKGKPKAVYAAAAVEEESDDSDAEDSGRGRRSAKKGKKKQLQLKSSAKSDQRRRRHTRASSADSEPEPAREPEGDGWFSALVEDVSKPRLMPPVEDADANPMPMADCDDPGKADIRL